MLRYVDMVRRSLAEKVWLPPRGQRAALRFARPPRDGGGGPPGSVGPARRRRSSASLPRSSAPRFSGLGAWSRGASGCSAPAGAAGGPSLKKPPGGLPGGLERRELDYTRI